MADKDTIFGELAVERGLITPGELDEARADKAVLEGRGMRQSLPQILHSKELLDKEQVRELRREVAKRTGEASRVAGYEIIRQIGSGGMGTVYKARRIETGVFVALKIVPRELATEELIARFKREAEITGRLDCENIVKCIEFGYDERHKCHFCALELVEGEDLAKEIKRQGKLSEKEAVSVASQVAEALRHAQSRGLVHRDVKPENIMVTREGTAKLLDLGLARRTDLDATRFTQSGMFVGTAYYASPEQARGERALDIRTDIYSLGATLYHMVTGRPPFTGSTSMAILQKHITEKAPWPGDVNPELSDDFCRVIAGMMAKELSARYQTPADLLGDLEKVRAGQPPETEEMSLYGSSIALPLKALPLRLPRKPKAPRKTPTPAAPRTSAPPTEILPLPRAARWRSLPPLAWVASAGTVAVVLAVLLAVAVNPAQRGTQGAKRTGGAVAREAPPSTEAKLPVAPAASRIDFLDAVRHQMRGVAYSEKGHHDRAIAEYTKAIELSPDFAVPYHLRGNAHAQKRDRDRAIADYTKAIELSPDNAEAYKNRGLVYYRKVDFDRAIADYTTAIALKPDYADAYYNRGIAYLLKRDHDRAIADYTKAIALKPDNTNAYYMRGQAYKVKGVDERAIADFTIAIALKPDYADVYFCRGLAYDEKGDHDRARKDLVKAATLDPRGAIGRAAKEELRRLEE